MEFPAIFGTRMLGLAAPLSLSFGVKDAGLGPQGHIGFVSRYI